jgi:hypothetical protein
LTISVYVLLKSGLLLIVFIAHVSICLYVSETQSTQPSAHSSTLSLTDLIIDHVSPQSSLIVVVVKPKAAPHNKTFPNLDINDVLFQSLSFPQINPNK